jgi:hypothetical protein
MNEEEFALAQLRHAYQLALEGRIGSQEAFAKGLLGPAIERLEPLLDSRATGRGGTVGVGQSRVPNEEAMTMELTDAQVAAIARGETYDDNGEVFQRREHIASLALEVQQARLVKERVRQLREDHRWDAAEEEIEKWLKEK